MRTEGFRGALISALIVASLMVSAISLLSVSPSSAAPDGLTPHDPIYIDGNDNFTPANGVNGGGTGTENDPYIIENWDINASSAHGIWIRNTTAHFIIRNCYVHDGWVNYIRGIYFNTSVINGKIDNNRVENNYCGIYLDYGSDNNLVSNNLAENNRLRGILLYDSDYNLIDNNLMENNYYGIHLNWYSDNNLLSNNLVENNYYGIYLESSSYDNLINNTCSNNDYGILLGSSDNNLISNNLAENNDYGILLGSSDNNLISNNLAENNYYGIGLSTSSNNFIRNNTAESNYDGGIYLSGSSNNFIGNNTAESNSRDGILLYLSDNNTLTGNTAENNFWYGIYLDYSDNNTLTGNTAENNYYFGIYLRSSDNNMLTGNTLLNNRYNFGIFGTTLSHFVHDIDTSNLVNGKPIRYLVGNENEIIGPSLKMGYLALVNCDNIRVENIALGNNVRGILLAFTRNSRVENNTFENNSHGIHLFYSYNNTLTGNTASGNSYGISLISSSNNLIENNLVENNNTGIHLYIYSRNNLVSNNLVGNNSYIGIFFQYYSDNNLIYHNNILNNVNQAYDDGSNYWDDGYPSGGNYWSDYTGVDNYRGENQDIPGSDGIGDVPYYILGDNNQDRYPLMEPWPPEVEKVSWDALIAASFSEGSDDAIFGVRPDATSGFDNAYDIPEPPAPPEPPRVRAYFYYPGQTPGKLHRSLLAPENLMEWPLRIEYADNIENVTLTWSVENIPADYSVFLYQEENLVADMRAENNYTFEASTGSYDFRIVVGKFLPFTLELSQGWNMISFPVLPENSSPDSIFGGYYVLYRWDAENSRYVLHADSGSFIEPDPDVEVGVGYWVYVLEDENVDLLGVPVSQLTLSLRQGWNLIGPPYGGSDIADPADDPDNSVIPWAFTWNAREKSYGMTQLLEAGRGYWAHALRDCTLTLSP